jgi:hypothetical protein
VSGSVVTSNATATGGASGDVFGDALARSKYSGLSGTYTATATTGAAAGLVTALSAAAQGSVKGSGEAEAEAAFSAATPTSGGYQALAVAIADPLKAGAAAVLADNSQIGVRFGAAPTYVAQGELGGEYQNGGGGDQTITDQIDMSLESSGAATSGELWLGLYNGASLGAGVSGLTFQLEANGGPVVNESFQSAAAAGAFFGGEALDLGAWSALGSSGTIALQMTMTETTTSAGSGLAGNFLLGVSHG